MKKERKEIFQFWLLPGIILIIAAAVIRFNSPGLFYNFYSGEYSAYTMSTDNELFSFATLAATAFNKLFKEYFYYYLLPNIFLLLPGIYFTSLGIYGFTKKDCSFFQFLEKKKNEFVFLISVGIFVFIFVLFLFYKVTGIQATVTDEFSYIFQAQMLSSGKLYAESPRLRDFFHTAYIINDGRWYSQYTIGWPLLLAIGMLVRVPFVIPPICAALSAVLLYAVGRILLGVRGGIFALYLALLSPFFQLQGGTFFSHTPVGLFLLLYLWTLLKLFYKELEKRPVYLILSCISVIMLPLTRPVDGFLIFTGLIPFAAYLIYKSYNRKKAIIDFIIICASFAAGIILLLLINRIQSGSPFTFGYHKYPMPVRMGLGVEGHTLFKGFWNLVYSVMRSCYWSAPFIIPLAVISIFKKDLKLTFLFIPVAAFVIFYLFVLEIGYLEIGSRFYYPVFLILFILASAGIEAVGKFLPGTQKHGANCILPAFMVCITVYMSVGVYPKLYPDLTCFFMQKEGFLSWITNPPEHKPPTLVFLRDNYGKKNFVYTRNFWNYKNSDRIIVLYLTPEENKKIIEQFPRHTPLMVVIDNLPGGGEKFRMVPVNLSETPENYMWAGLNYQYAVFDNKKAEEAYLKGLKIDPTYAQLTIELGSVYLEEKRYNDALALYDKLMKDPQLYPMGLFLKGKTYSLMGDKKKARGTFNEVIRQTPYHPMAQKAREILREGGR